MYELSIETSFSAAHAIRIGGTPGTPGIPEPTHGHDWRVTATIGGETLDEDGLLCDFHTIEESLRAITSRFHNRNLNETAPFDRTNPTAELVARHIAEALAPMLPPEARLIAVRITEAPGCAATYRPGPPA